MIDIMNSKALINILLFFAFISLFIQFSALISLKAVAVYVFGGATIIFALLAMMVALLTD